MSLRSWNDGWRLVRTKGSHRQFHHPSKPGTVTVAGHPSLDIPPGTLNNMREAIEFHLEGMRQRGDAIPAPSATTEYITV